MNYELYVITDRMLSGGRSHEEIACLAIDGGADIIQLRDKTCSSRRLVEEAKRVRDVTLRTSTPFIVNDRLDVAIASGADGVHLGSDDLPVASVRAMVPRGFIIGASVGSADEAIQAVREGADYLAASPVFPTAQKPEASVHCGIEGLRKIRKAVSVPLVAIGGIGLGNVCDVIGAGADGVAVISAVVGQPDIRSAAHDLKLRVQECKAARFHSVR